MGKVVGLVGVGCQRNRRLGVEGRRRRGSRRGVGRLGWSRCFGIWSKRSKRPMQWLGGIKVRAKQGNRSILLHEGMWDGPATKWERLWLKHIPNIVGSVCSALSKSCRPKLGGSQIVLARCL